MVLGSPDKMSVVDAMSATRPTTYVSQKGTGKKTWQVLIFGFENGLRNRGETAPDHSTMFNYASSNKVSGTTVIQQPLRPLRPCRSKSHRQHFAVEARVFRSSRRKTVRTSPATS